ncbi:uncharacterized protein LOC115242748 [Formica exsecta]|uniref:uncharacterized protein LOC115242748 n=1 Tax=Formica exsecta TaxID=72781 RepID=UPI001144F0F5|nr:uncharacterized protein LOC115242748 [Formica exsecta]
MRNNFIFYRKKMLRTQREVFPRSEYVDIQWLSKASCSRRNFSFKSVSISWVVLLVRDCKKERPTFLETQNCVGTALTALGAAVSMLIDPPEEGLDEDIFTDYLSHAGQSLTDVFHQQSLARKSFVTPQLNKNIKQTVDAMISDKWLYGNNLKEKVKDAKEIEKACAEIKNKVQQKYSSKSNRGNSKYPPANYRQVGYQQKRY